MFINKIIDSQERSKENLSALYLNNRKIQTAKNSQDTLEAFEFFVDFLDFYKLNSTKEIFLAETNYSKDEGVFAKLKNQFRNDKKCMGVQLLEKIKLNGKKRTSVKMDDLKEKSKKLDLLIQRKNKQTELKKLEQSISSKKDIKSRPDEFQISKETEESVKLEQHVFENVQLKKKIAEANSI